MCCSRTAGSYAPVKIPLGQPVKWFSSVCTCECVFGTTESHRSVSQHTLEPLSAPTARQNHLRFTYSVQANLREPAGEGLLVCQPSHFYMCYCRLSEGGVEKWGKWVRSYSTCSSSLIDKPMCVLVQQVTEKRGGRRRGRQREDGEVERTKYHAGWSGEAVLIERKKALDPFSSM